MHQRIKPRPPLTHVTSTFTDPPRLWAQVAALTALLALLFAGLEPPPTAHLGFLMAVLAWAAHIGAGMACALLATRLLLRLQPALGRRPWTTLLAGGLLGATAFTPVALVLEALLPAAPTAPADDWLDAWEAAGGARAFVAEWLSLVPSYLPAWLLVNAMPMLQVAQPRLVADGGDAPPAPGPAAPGPAAPGPGEPAPVAGPVAGPAPAPAHGLGDDEGLIERLPLAIGRHLVSISSDLHYLQVVTRRGRATLLGSLAEAEAELGARGLRIHRSHWVAFDAIRRLRRTAQGWRCELHDGRSLPVSRRRASDIKQRLGTDFVIE